jgi:hypothetical protein
VIEWDKLPALLQEWVDEDRNRLVNEIDEKETFRLRVRIAVYRKILAMAEPDPYDEVMDDDG